MIDTLKLSRRLENAGMDRRQAEELAEGLSEGLKDSFGAELKGLRGEVQELKADIRWIKWMLGTLAVANVGVLGKLLVS
jgi:hypothetical protein